MEKKNKRLIILVTILLLTIGVSFAYFTGNLLITGSGSNIEAMAGKYLTVEYQAGSRMTGQLEPGSAISKNFTVKITPYKDQKEATYVIKFNIDNNTFQKCTSSLVDTYHCLEDEEELIYTLKDNTGRILKTGDITGVTGNVVIYQETKEVEQETSFTYIFEITFKETNGSQNHNKNKVVNGNLNVEYGTKTDVNIMAVYIIDQEGHETRSDRIPQATDNTIYKFNTTRSKCDKGATPIWENERNGLFISNLKESGTECELYFDLLNVKTINSLIATADKTSITTSTGFGVLEPKNGVTPAPGLYEFEGITSGSKTQFYRGAVTNNYVRLGKDEDNYTYWRIVRFDEEGNIRLIYDGTNAHDNGEASNDRQLTTDFNGVNIDKRKYHSTDAEANVRWSNSEIKTYLNGEWLTAFEGRLSDKEKGQLVTGKFCSDISVSKSEGGKKYFGTYGKLNTNKAPSFRCDSGEITECKVGILSTDEYSFAGGGGYGPGSTNTSFYLYTGKDWWTLSPFIWISYYNGDASVLRAYESGYLNDANLSSNPYGVRPVITLDKDTLFNSSTNGTKTNPYILAPDSFDLG